MVGDDLFLMVLLAAIVLPSAWIDFRQRRIPNEICLAGILLGVAFNVINHGLSGLTDSVFGFFLAFAIGFPLWMAGWMGAGDVKLVAAIGAIVGVNSVLPVLAGIAIAGGVFALGYLLWNRIQDEPLSLIVASALSAGGTEKSPLPKAEGGDKKQKGIPYAIPVAFGSLATIVYLS